MMIKAELEKLRALPATPAMIRALKKPGVKECGSERKYYYYVAGRCQQLNGILKVSISTREDIKAGERTPRYDIFINYAGDTYISRERQNDGTYKWRTAMIHNLIETYWWDRKWNEFMYINPEGNRAIKSLLHVNEGGSDGIMIWQQGCRKRAADKKINEQKEVWDEAMKPVRDTPKGFDDWWKHNGFDGENFIYYSGAGAQTGFCTSCLKKVELQGKPVHNGRGRCPVCRKLITFISRAKKRVSIYTNFRDVSCVQRYKDGVIERNFSVRRIDTVNSTGDIKVEFLEDEDKRTIIQNKKYETYKWTDYRGRGYTWAIDDEAYGPTREIERVYPRNITQVLKKYHTAYPIAVKKGHRVSLKYFLWRENKCPAIELAYKAGLYRLGREMISDQYDSGIDNEQTELHKMLKIDKSRMSRMKKMDGGITQLAWLQYEKKQNTQYADEDIQMISSADIEPDNFKRSRAGKYLSLKKCCNYLLKQREYRADRTAAGLKIRAIWNDWNDYISMLEKMKMDCSKEILLKPKDLTLEHNRLVTAVSLKDSEEKIKETEDKFDQAKALLESGELKKYEYEDDKYAIVVPHSIKDIYEEGLTLKHCIHTCDIYFQRIDIQETYLLFLRKKEQIDKPWYTLEIEPGGNIRQKKSVLNEAYKDLDDALPFLKKWQKWVKKNLSKKDKALAEKSNKARIDGYKKLREDKKVIWHGRLQGTLLADALEDDFMEVG